MPNCIAARLKTNGVCQLVGGYYVPIKYPGYVVMHKHVHHRHSFILDDPALDELDAVPEEPLVEDDPVLEGESLPVVPVYDELLFV